MLKQEIGKQERIQHRKIGVKMSINKTQIVEGLSQIWEKWGHFLGYFSVLVIRDSCGSVMPPILD